MTIPHDVRNHAKFPYLYHTTTIVRLLPFVRPPYKSSIHRLPATSDLKASAMEIEDSLKRDDLLLEVQEASPMLTTKEHNVNSRGSGTSRRGLSSSAMKMCGLI